MNSMFVMWNKALLPFLLAAKNPLNFACLPMLVLASVSAVCPSAMAFKFSLTFLLWPASIWSDSWVSWRSSAGIPAGVVRCAEISATLAVSTKAFKRFGAAA